VDGVDCLDGRMGLSGSFISSGDYGKEIYLAVINRD
jgi:hypothetical protein